MPGIPAPQFCCSLLRSVQKSFKSAVNRNFDKQSDHPHQLHGVETCTSYCLLFLYPPRFYSIPSDCSLRKYIRSLFYKFMPYLYWVAVASVPGYIERGEGQVPPFLVPDFHATQYPHFGISHAIIWDTVLSTFDVVLWHCFWWCTGRHDHFLNACDLFPCVFTGLH